MTLSKAQVSDHIAQAKVLLKEVQHLILRVIMVLNVCKLVIDNIKVSMILCLVCFK